ISCTSAKQILRRAPRRLRSRRPFQQGLYLLYLPLHRREPAIVPAYCISESTPVRTTRPVFRAPGSGARNLLFPDPLLRTEKLTTEYLLLRGDSTVHQSRATSHFFGSGGLNRSSTST